MKPESSGVVLDVRSNSIAVAFQESSECTELPENQYLALVKLANDVTYRSLHSSLHKRHYLRRDINQLSQIKSAGTINY